MIRSLHLARPRRSVATWAAVALLCAGMGLSQVPAHADTVTYTYDQLGRLTKVEYGDGSKVVFAYDAAGNRTTAQTVSTEGNKRVASLLEVILMLLDD